MSKENVHSFLTDTYRNEELRGEMADVKSVDEIIAKAASAGYEFTPEEFQQGSLEFADKYDVEMNEAELEATAGGYCSVFSYACCCSNDSEQIE